MKNYITSRRFGFEVEDSWWGRWFIGNDRSPQQRHEDYAAEIKRTEKRIPERRERGENSFPIANGRNSDDNLD